MKTTHSPTPVCKTSAADPHADGFGGARDAAIFHDYMDEETPLSGIVRVQCTERTEGLLRRAGYVAPLLHDTYSVSVAMHQVYGWLELVNMEVTAGEVPATAEGRSAGEVVARRLRQATATASRAWVWYKTGRTAESLAAYTIQLRRCERLQSTLRTLVRSGA